MVTGLLLAVAVSAFAGLAYQQVPMSTTQAITKESIQTSASYSLYLVANTVTYTTTSTTTTIRTEDPTTICDNSGQYPSYCVGYPAATATLIYIYTDIPAQSIYSMQETSIVPYSQTLTSSVTESSTSLVPASAALGLTDGSFTLVAGLVIGILAILMTYLILKPGITHRPKQATLSQFVKVPTTCVNCGAALPPVSDFCNKCGTKQT